jgi:hypothetical protein
MVHMLYLDKSKSHTYHMLLGDLHDSSPRYFIQLLCLGEHLILGSYQAYHAIVAIFL